MNEIELRIYRQYFLDIIRCLSKSFDACEEYDLDKSLDHLESAQFWMDTFKNRLILKRDEDDQF
jgi:hypothetical protein